MKDKNLYIPLWKKYLPVIRLQMKNALNGPKEIKMSKVQFEDYGARKAANYLINLVIKKSRVQNSIKNTAVAKDLFDVLNEDKQCRDLMEASDYTFTLGAEFIFRINVDMAVASS